jgi:S1-C subfamily serine protease
VTVEPGSPAFRAGLEAGDTIIAYNGSDLRAAGEIALDRLLVPDDTLRVGLRRSGRSMTLPVVVGRAPAAGSLQALSANGPGFSYIVINNGGPEPAVAPVAPTTPMPTMGPRSPRLRAAARTPEAPPAPGTPPATAIPAPMLFSFGLGSSAAIAGAQVVAIDDDLGAVVGSRSGVLVVKVIDGTPAGSAGLRSGDVVVRADGAAVTSPAMLQRALLRAGDERAVVLRVSRRGKARDVSLRW